MSVFVVESISRKSTVRLSVVILIMVCFCSLPCQQILYYLVYYHILNYSSRLGKYKKAFALANPDWVVTMTKKAASLLPHFGRNLEAINLDENGSRLDETIGQARTLFAL